jgi:hypothetical protein
MNVQNSYQWKLSEFVQIGADVYDGGSGIPLQLLSLNVLPATEESQKSSIWFLGGFSGPSKNDAHVVNLLQRAIEKATFDPVLDIYMTPVVNSSSSSKAPKLNHQGIDVSNCFGDLESGKTLPLEAKCLIRWAKTIQPKAVITFSNGPSPFIRYLNAPNEIMQRLAELAERNVYSFGTEPEDKLEDGTFKERESSEATFGAWCVTQGISWIDFRIDSTKKSFNDVKDADWRPSFGPAIKWLVEGFRFNPPAEEPAYELPQVIPALEMPPEFANL